jgi:hypothetical protein
MRDKRFVAAHRGGPLTLDRHHHIIKWAKDCSNHVIKLISPNVDTRLIHALHIAQEWEKGKASVGDARKASFGAHVVAKETPDPVITAVARSIGHAVATAHMADHSLGAAEYALKAVKLSGKSAENERKWQDEQLTPDIAELILTAREKKKLRL